MDAVDAGSSGKGSYDTARFLEELAGRGIRLWVESGRLQCSARPDRLDEAVRARLKAERDALIALLTPAPATVEASEPGLVAIPAEAPRVLTLAQESLLPLARARQAESLYNVPLVLDIAGSLDLNILYGVARAP
ncbi:hypothetical protein EV667_1257 [Ancylobacter aquaticus]|uniref:TubC N-terminal docking domain-containing protein n=1 Tax=Ancylobacter aquaticus TaxID=100 RepID=A0A4R1IHR9_ANCAQ|nr:hypothetical protein [Ancylobacter aquaticus]TCK31152.1 hypothetical protein EV667_1257 [Ancylobacter aquaticus]